MHTMNAPPVHSSLQELLPAVITLPAHGVHSTVYQTQKKLKGRSIVLLNEALA